MKDADAKEPMATMTACPYFFINMDGRGGPIVELRGGDAAEVTPAGPPGPTMRLVPPLR